MSMVHPVQRLLTALVVSLLTLCTARSATIFVPDQYPAIQTAIAAAATGDTIIVRQGAYVENIDFLGKAITVTSESGPSVTIIDGGQAGSTVTFAGNEGTDSTIEGFTITNGSGTYIWNGDYGGGVICRSASPTIRGNIIIANTPSHSGGGIYCEDGAPVILDNRIEANGVGFSGAGIYLLESGSLVEGNTISDNQGSNDGGGIFCYGFDVSPVFDGNVISDNIAGWGGGICCRLTLSEGAIVDNIISGNRAITSGGGIYERGVPTIRGNRISGNNAGVDGGGFYGIGSQQLFANNVVCGNYAAKYGGGMRFFYSTPSLTHNTITGNIADTGGGGISFFSTLYPTILANSIVWGNSSPDGIAIQLDGEFHGFGFLAVGYSDLEGGPSAISVGPFGTLSTGQGLIAADPLFTKASCDDYHLDWDSPCRNTGNNDLSFSLTEDFEGDPRTTLGMTEMGADEFWYHLYHVGDVIPGGTIEINVVGKPQLPVTLLLGAALADPPINTPHGELKIQWPPLWQGGIGSIPSGGILKYPASVPSIWPVGKIIPLQALVGPWGGPMTRLTNLLLLTTE
jgi:hypothetical protein